MTRFIHSLVLCALVMAFGPFSFDAAADDGKAALKFAPKEITGVIALNVERLKSSPLYGSLISLFSMSDAFNAIRQELKTEGGVDIEKDLKSIVMLIPAENLSGEILVAVNGTLDQAKITAFAKREGMAEEKVGGQVMLKDSSGPEALAFAGDHFLFGTADLLKSALGSGGALGADISKLTTAADASKDLWIAIEITKDIKNKFSYLDNVKSVIGSLDLSTDFVLKLTVEASSAETAQKFIEDFNSAIDFINKETTAPKLGFAGPISRLKLSASGTTVHVHFDITAAELDTIQKALNSR